MPLKKIPTESNNTEMLLNTSSETQESSVETECLQNLSSQAFIIDKELSGKNNVEGEYLQSLSSQVVELDKELSGQSKNNVEAECLQNLSSQVVELEQQLCDKSSNIYEQYAENSFIGACEVVNNSILQTSGTQNNINKINTQNFLPIESKAKFEHVEQAKTNFLNEIESNGIDINTDNIILTSEQKNLVEKFGKSFIPRKLRKQITNFSNSQINEHKKLILLKQSRIIKYITMLVPECYCITPDDNTIIRMLKCNKTSSLPINVILSDYNIKDISKINDIDRDQTQYLFGCADKVQSIEDKKPAEIFIFVPSYHVSDECKIAYDLKSTSINIVYYSELKYYPQFLGGVYKFLIRSKEQQKSLYNEDKSATATKNKLKINENNVEQDFNELKERARKKLCILQRNLFYNNVFTQNKTIPPVSAVNNSSEINASIRMRINRKVKIFAKRKSEYLLLESSGCKRISMHIDARFANIKQQMEKKYEKEKQDKTYDINRLIESKIFNFSTFKTFSNSEEENEYVRNILYDIQKIGIDRDWKLQETNIHGFVLLPPKFYINENDTPAVINEKTNLLLNAKIQKLHFVYSTKTGNREKSEDRKKLIIATMGQIENINTDNNTIILCLPIMFENDKPLHDPNQFLLKCYFYNNINSYNQVLGYPLYEFSTKAECNVYDPGDEKSRKMYLDMVVNINNVTLEEYLKQAYKTIDARVIARAKNLQESVIVLNKYK